MQMHLLIFHICKSTEALIKHPECNIVNVILLKDFNIGLAITVVDMTAACVKHVDRRGFEINTPFKSFW